MSNIFQEVLTDAQGVQNKLLGPTYPYYKNIKTPSQIGMSDKGTLKQMGKDIDGLIQYVELLVSGKSSASATGGPSAPGTNGSGTVSVGTALRTGRLARWTLTMFSSTVVMLLSVSMSGAATMPMVRSSSVWMP